MKLRWHKLTHWEYWPVYVVYQTTFWWWIVMALRFRSVRFYRRSNPSITNGGLHGDSKMDIYRLLPTDVYPRTILIDNTNRDHMGDVMSAGGLSYPVIAKPDIGCRGVDVKRITCLEDLLTYAAEHKLPFLIQEMITWPNEMGLFYCRIPGERSGRITGITHKKFLSVEGNGRETIGQLLSRKPRYAMQTRKLANTMDLNEIIPAGEQRVLVPYGNHNRGTEFLDGSDMITPRLEETIDNILSKVDGFYYGRLDIRYNSLSDLEEVRNFSIIEVNGAKSEPTHIYDPRYSFWRGQREIWRHQRIFFQIIKKAEVGDLR